MTIIITFGYASYTQPYENDNYYNIWLRQLYRALSERQVLKHLATPVVQSLMKMTIIITLATSVVQSLMRKTIIKTFCYVSCTEPNEKDNYYNILLRQLYRALWERQLSKHLAASLIQSLMRMTIIITFGYVSYTQPYEKDNYYNIWLRQFYRALSERQLLWHLATSVVQSLMRKTIILSMGSVPCRAPLFEKSVLHFHFSLHRVSYCCREPPLKKCVMHFHFLLLCFLMLQSTSVWEERAALPILPPSCILLLQSTSVEELCAARSFLTNVFPNAAEHLCLRRACCTSISPSIVYPIAAEHLRWRNVCCTFISYYCVS